MENINLEIEKSWIEESEWRLQELNEGKVVRVPAEEVTFPKRD